MPIDEDNLLYLYSGGAANSNGGNSLGGVKSSEEIPDDTLHNLTDLVTGAENAAGQTIYRIIYIENQDSRDAYNVKLYLLNNEESEISIAVDEGKNTVAQVLASETASPGNLTWVSPSTEGTAMALGLFEEDDYRAVYIRRVVAAGGEANDEVNAELRLVVDSPE